MAAPETEETMPITQGRLRKAVRYDRRSGHFFWKEAGPKRKLGMRAGAPNKRLGYWVIGLDGERYYAHDLAWLCIYGRWPRRLEFINKDGFDASIHNLREHVQFVRGKETKVCRSCAEVFNRDRSHSDAQWASRMFCSRQCAQDCKRKLINVHRPCRKCGRNGPFHSYITAAGNRVRRTLCRRCWNAKRRRKRGVRERLKKAANPEKYLYSRMVQNSRQRGHRLDISYDEFLREIGGKMPTHCPVLGILLDPCAPAHSPNLPTVDRLESEKPYGPGNIAIISWRANALKKDGTLSEIKSLGDWLGRLKAA